MFCGGRAARSPPTIMKLWLGSTALHDLARHLQVLSQASAREPAEAPQRERRTVRVRLEFREDSYLQNRQLVEQVRAALKTPTTSLKWQDDSGATFVERWVIIGDDDQPEGENAWGTYTQSITFSFIYFVHDLTTNCLPASLQRKPDGAVKDLGAILKWSDQLVVDRFHDMRDPRRTVMHLVTASGRLQGNTATTSLDTTRTALLVQKNALLDEIVAGKAFQLVYGTGATKFDKAVRVQRFTADVDQPNYCIEWNLTAQFTRHPDETDYAWMEYEVTSRETKSEGIVSLGLRGRIAASSDAKARATLLTITSGAGSVIPAGYVQVSESITPHSVTSADGAAFLEIIFDLDYRDTTSITCRVKKSGGATLLDLGVVERFATRYAAEMVDSMRKHRKRAGGVLTSSGRIFAADNLTLAAKQAELLAKKGALDALFDVNASIDLSYGNNAPDFNNVHSGTIRIADWDCQINRLRNCLEWSVQASYTRFPNESDYAVTEFRTGTRERKLEGDVLFTLSGRIGAPTAEAARERLARLRAAVVPAGYALLDENTQENKFSSESGRNSVGGDVGDGDTFTQLDFTDEYQKTTGDILTWSLKTTNADDVRTGFVLTTYSGSVTAKGTTRDAAWLAALTQAETLGAGKYPFQVRSTVTENDKFFQTTGGISFVAVDFAYEYQRKGLKVYLEVSAERTTDTFGQTTETINGYVAAPDLATAQAAYLTDVRNLAEYADKLLLNERAPTKSRQLIKDVVGADQFDRFSFSFAVFVSKTAGETAMEYSIQTSANLQTLEQTAVVTGRVLAPSEALALDHLTTYLATLDIGVRCGQPVRKANYQRGAKVSGSGTAEAFLGLEFTETYMQRLTGEDGILECEVTEQIRFSGQRIVEKAIPGGISLFQHTGTTPGQRVVSGRVKATTEVAALNWAKKCRALMLTAAALYEEAAVVTTSLKFIPRTDGTARGSGANVLSFETSFSFSEFLPEHPYVP